MVTPFQLEGQLAQQITTPVHHQGKYHAYAFPLVVFSVLSDKIVMLSFSECTAGIGSYMLLSVLVSFREHCTYWHLCQGQRVRCSWDGSSCEFAFEKLQDSVP